MCNSSAHSGQFFSALSVNFRPTNAQTAIRVAQDLKTGFKGPKGTNAVRRLYQGQAGACNEIRCLQDRHAGCLELEIIRAFIIELGRFPRINITDKKARGQFSELISSLRACAGLPSYRRKTKPAAKAVKDPEIVSIATRREATTEEANI